MSMNHPEHNTNGINTIMMFSHALPVELFDNILLSLSPGDIASLLEAMDLDIRIINRLSFFRLYCQKQLAYFFRNYSLMHNAFNLLVGRYSSKKNFYNKLFTIIVDAHLPSEDLYSSIEINSDWLNVSEHSHHIQNSIIEQMLKTFVYRENRHGISAVQLSDDWKAYVWPTTIFPLTFSLLVHYPQIFQNQGEEGPDMIFKCFRYDITFSMIQSRILALTASGEEPTFDTVFSDELFSDKVQYNSSLGWDDFFTLLS